MSIHDQYFSEMNKKYIYNLLTQIIQKDFNYDISNDESYQIFFNDSIKSIFEKNNADDISFLNQELLNYNLNNFKKLNDNNLNNNLIINNENPIMMKY